MQTEFNSVKEVMSQFDSHSLNFTNFHPGTYDERAEPNLLFIWIKGTRHVIHTYQKIDEVWKEVF